jgi:DNA-binding XRE family transcriptional regulator
MSQRTLSLEEARNASLRSARDRLEYERIYVQAVVSAMLVEMRKQARLSRKQLARRSKLRLVTLTALEEADETVNPTLTDLVRVAVACGFDLATLVAPANSRRKPICYPMSPSGL